MNGLLAGVMNANFYDSDGNLILSSKTLMESGITFSITAEEARGGEGNALLGRYYHTSSFGLTLTDQVFNLKYLALNCGGAITAGADVITEEEITITEAGKITVNGTPTAVDNLGTIGWYRLQTNDDSSFQKITFIGKVASVEGLVVGTKVCVKYTIVNDAARKFRVNTQFIPSVVRAELIGKLFRTGNSGMSSGTGDNGMENLSQIGTVIVKVPQFQFDGNVTLNLTSTTNASVPLTGQALANYTGSCNSQGWYAEIIEVPFTGGPWTNVNKIAVAGGVIKLKSGEFATLEVWRTFNDGTKADKVRNSLLTFTAETGKTSVFTVTADGVVTAGSTAGTGFIEVIATDQPELKSIAQITVTTT